MLLIIKLLISAIPDTFKPFNIVTKLVKLLFDDDDDDDDELLSRVVIRVSFESNVFFTFIASETINLLITLNACIMSLLVFSLLLGNISYT